MTIEFTDVQRPRRLASRTTIPGRAFGMHIEGVLTFNPVGQATRMHWSWTIHPHGPLRLAGPLVAALGRRQEQAIWSSLKQYLEAGGGAATPPRT